jgi:hypothetical protein
VERCGKETSFRPPPGPGPLFCRAVGRLAADGEGAASQIAAYHGKFGRASRRTACRFPESRLPRTFHWQLPSFPMELQH